MKRKTNNIYSRVLITVVTLLVTSFLTLGQDLQKGIWYLNQRQYQTAKNIFQSLIKKDTSDAKAMYYLGQVHYFLGSHDSAGYYYQRGVHVNPKESFNYLGAGKLLLNQANRVEWVKLYDKGRKVSQDLFSYNLEAAASILDATKKYYDLAQIYLESAKKEKENDPMLFIGYGNLYLQSKTPGEAVNEYERAIYYDKSCDEAYLRTGEIYSRANDFRNALNAYNQVIITKPEQILAYKLRGDLYYNFAKYPEAKSDYDIYMSRADKNLEDQQKYIFILFFSKNYTQATSLIDNMLAASPELSILYRIKAYIDYETEQYDEGLINIEKFFQTHDSTRFIALDYIYYGRLLIKNEKDSVGCIQLEKALAMDSTKVEVYDDLAKAYSRTRDFKKSNEVYNKMLNLNSSNQPNIYYQIGRNYYFMAEDTLSGIDSISRVSNYIKADSNFLKVTELNPESYIGFIWRGRTHSRLDPETTSGLAKTDYEQAMALLEKGDVSKTPKLLIECYRYLGFYYYMMAENSQKSEPELIKSAILNSIDYWKKILALDPNDNQALTALENLKVE